MQRAEILAELRRYIAQDVLDGRDMGLNESTPLMEWGVLNSLEIVRLLSHIQTTFNVDIPPDQVVAEQFADLNAITDLVLRSTAA